MDNEVKDKNIDTPKGQQIKIVYLKANEKVKVGDVIEGKTRDRESISNGWRSESFLASYKIIPSKAK